MLLDNGKTRISALDGVPLIEIYHDGELSLEDVQWIRHAVLHELIPAPPLPLDIIIDRQGAYSLMAEAYVQMSEIMRETGRVAYITRSPVQEALVELARASYLAGKPVASFSSVAPARAWLKSYAATADKYGT